MKKKQVEFATALRYAVDSMHTLEQVVADMRVKYVGKTVWLEDPLGHKDGGYVNSINVKYIAYHYWFGDDRMHLCVAFNISPLYGDKTRAHVSHHNNDFYNPSKITPDNWTKFI